MRGSAVCAHAAGVGALIAVEDALVILCRDERDEGFPVGDGDEADFFAGEKFFDDEVGAELFNRGFGFRSCLAR